MNSNPSVTTVDRAFALHVAVMGSFPGILYGSLRPAELIPDFKKATSNFCA